MTEIDDMSARELNVAIAEAKGWVQVHYEGRHYFQDPKSLRFVIPNWANNYYAALRLLENHDVNIVKIKDMYYCTILSIITGSISGKGDELRFAICRAWLKRMVFLRKESQRIIDESLRRT